jgi:hypothetical protein
MPDVISLLQDSGAGEFTATLHQGHDLAARRFLH